MSFFCELVYPAAIEARRVAQINSFASHGRLLNSQWAAALPAPLVLRFVCSARQSCTLSSYRRLFVASGWRAAAAILFVHDGRVRN